MARMEITTNVDVSDKSYTNGFKMGMMHASLGFEAMSSRTWSVSFRNGYSDGYAAKKERI
jgi:hypothetical protein